MEEKKEYCGECKECAKHYWHHASKYRILRWILGIVILIIVFSLGIKLGELKGIINQGFYGNYGYNMMGGWGNNRYNNFYGPREMMQGYWPGMMGGYYYGTTTPR